MTNAAEKLGAAMLLAGIVKAIEEGRKPPEGGLTEEHLRGLMEEGAEKLFGVKLQKDQQPSDEDLISQIFGDGFDLRPETEDAFSPDDLKKWPRTCHDAAEADAAEEDAVAEIFETNGSADVVIILSDLDSASPAVSIHTNADNLTVSSSNTLNDLILAMDKAMRADAVTRGFKHVDSNIEDVLDTLASVEVEDADEVKDAGDDPVDHDDPAVVSVERDLLAGAILSQTKQNLWVLQALFSTDDPDFDEASEDLISMLEEKQNLFH